MNYYYYCRLYARHARRPPPLAAIRDRSSNRSWNDRRQPWQDSKLAERSIARRSLVYFYDPRSADRRTLERERKSFTPLRGEEGKGKKTESLKIKRPHTRSRDLPSPGRQLRRGGRRSRSRLVRRGRVQQDHQQGSRSSLSVSLSLSTNRFRKRHAPSRLPRRVTRVPIYFTVAFPSASFSPSSAK